MPLGFYIDARFEWTVLSGDIVPHVLLLPPGDREWIVWGRDSGAIVRRVQDTRCDKESPAGQTLQGTAYDARRMRTS
jgi:hypothetical protein